MCFKFNLYARFAFLTFNPVKRIVFKDRDLLETVLNKEAARIYD